MRQYIERVVSFSNNLPGTSTGVVIGFSAGVLLMALMIGQFWKAATILVVSAVLATVLGGIVGAIIMYRQGEK